MTIVSNHHQQEAPMSSRDDGGDVVLSPSTENTATFSHSSLPRDHQEPEQVAAPTKLTPFTQNKPTTVGPADVAIYWDYENVKIPNWCPATRAAESIRAKVMKYGRIVEKRLYYDSRQPTESTAPRSDLDLSGFTLVDCPSRNRKETLDKKLIVDVLCFAWERASMGAKACVVLITSDGDYSYAVARLRDIGVFAVIIYRPDIVAKVLIDNANVVMSWEFDVLGGPPQTLEDEDDDHTAPPSGPMLEASSSIEDDASKTGDRKPTTLGSTAQISKKPSTQTKAQYALFCSVLLNSQYQNVKEGISVYSSWANEASFALDFYEKFGAKDKEKYHTLRMMASLSGYIEWGRRDLTSAGKPVVKVTNRDDRGENLSPESYLRLTYSGMAVVNPDIASKESDWKIVLPKSNRASSIKDESSSTTSDTTSSSTSKDGRLFVGGLHWRTTEDSLRSHFKQFGPLKTVVMMDGRGFGFVFFKNPRDAQKCLDAADGHQVDNKTVE